MVYFVRADHIGRPAFATDVTGAVVWSASYLPFGEVRVSTGPLPPMRFPGQWFQSESGLHQNWMRDYDPTTGRYLQADPLGLVDGASVYGYARQNPGRWTDPSGEFTLGDAWESLMNKGVTPTPENGGSRRTYSRSQLLNEWLLLENQERDWLNDLPACPCHISGVDPKTWRELMEASQTFHSGGKWETRSKNSTTSYGAGSQCVYNASGQLMTAAPAAGSADRYSPATTIGIIRHFYHDVQPYLLAMQIGRIDDYFRARPVTGGTCCD